MNVHISQCMNGLVWPKHPMTLEEHTEGIWLPPMSDSDEDVVYVWLSAGTRECIKDIEKPSSRHRSIFAIASGHEGRVGAFGRIKTGPDTLKSSLQMKRFAQCT